MSAWWHKFLPRRSRTSAADVPEDRSLGGDPHSYRQRRVTLGLDFGTSTSKCCFREELERKPFIVVGYHTVDARESRVLLPTTAAFSEGCLYFGHDAERLAEPIKIRSFKMCLLCQARAERFGSGSGGIVACPTCLADRPGYFRIGERVLSAEDIATLYLAFVLNQALSRIRNVLGADARERRIVVNSAAPLDQMSEFGEVGEHFERALFYAWRMADRASRLWPLKDAMEQLSEARQESHPTTENSPTRVFPETHAAMTAYLLLPQSEQGLYGLVDVGAGTTDVAFFWLQKDQNETKAWYYAAGSKRLGMDDVDRLLAQVSEAKDGDLRAARESLSKDQWQRYRGHADPVTEGIYRHYASIFGDAKHIDQRHWAWFGRDALARYQLFFVGGGAMCEPLVEPMRSSPPYPMPGARWGEMPCSLTIPSTTKVALPDGTIVSLDQVREPASERLLLLSYGLSHPRPDIPKYDRDVEGVQVELKQRNTADVFTGHWW